MNLLSLRVNSNCNWDNVYCLKTKQVYVSRLTQSNTVEPALRQPMLNLKEPHFRSTKVHFSQYCTCIKRPPVWTLKRLHFPWSLEWSPKTDSAVSWCCVYSTPSLLLVQAYHLGYNQSDIEQNWWLLGHLLCYIVVLKDSPGRVFKLSKDYNRLS